MLLTGLGLSSVSTLFAIVSPLTLCIQGGLTDLVLGHLVNLVLLAFRAVSTDLLWKVDLYMIVVVRKSVSLPVHACVHTCTYANIDFSLCTL